MADKKIKEAIFSIFSKRNKKILTRVDVIKNNIINEIEELKKSDEFSESIIKEKLKKDLEEFDLEDEKITPLYNYIKEIYSSVNQLNLITNMLEGINNFCQRAALFLLKDDKLVGWGAKGFSGSEGEIKNEEIKTIFFSLSADTTFKKVLNDKKSYSGDPSPQPDDHLIYNRLGGDIPERIFILPFLVKGKPQAVIYSDSMKGEQIKEKEIEIIAIIGEMSLDLLPIKQKILSRVKTKEFDDETEAEIEMEQQQTTKIEFPEEIRIDDPERKARVIINDIILYNKDLVEQGRKNKNLAETLNDIILQAKEEFLRKFDNLSIFEQQLIEILAEGDKEALKGFKFETF